MEGSSNGSGSSSSAKEPLIPVGSGGPQDYTKLIRFMYVGHFLARWDARMWEFSVGLFMINIWPNSLLFAAIYGVVETAATAIFGSLVGRLLDRCSYVKVLQIWLLTQNSSFVIAGGAVAALLFFYDLRSTDFTLFMILVVLTNFSGAVGVLSTLAGTILIEREWVVVISNGQPPELLTRMNAVIRRIDLACKLLAPVFIGFIMSFISLRASALILASWNTISVWLEYFLLISVYKGIPALRQNCRGHRTLPTDFNDSPSFNEENEITAREEIHLDSNAGSLKGKVIECLHGIPCIDSWIIYLRQKVVLPGIALSLLYFSVLSYGTLMSATLEWKGIPAYIIGLGRGVAATIGIGATFSYPILHSNISTLRTGLWSIWAQWLCLVPCVISLWFDNIVTSSLMLMVGVAASRLGLWMFDLSVMQQMQDLVPESDRCVVGGVQNSLQSLLDLLTYIMGILISNPEDFGQLVVELKVGMHCEKCIRTIKKAIKKIEDIETYKVDSQLNKITVTGNVTAEEVLRVLQKIGKSATYWSEEQQVPNPAAATSDGALLKA